MTISDEQAKYLKEQLMKQIENIPEDKREAIKETILKMNNEQLEEFLIKNKLIKSGEGSDAEESSEEPENNKCIFCMIANKQISSIPIYEDEDFIAVLELNPVSRAHTLLIPKKHVSSVKDLKEEAFSAADKIGKHLLKKLKDEKAEDFKIRGSDELGHAVINIIPKYEGEEIGSEKKPAKKEELEKLAEKIGMVKKPGKKAKKEKGSEKIEKKESQKSEAPASKIDEEKAKSVMIKLPRRIP